MARRSVILLSGGLDSTILAYKLSKNTPLRAIYIDIGYLPSLAEKNSAKWVARKLDIPIEIVDMQGIFGMVSGFVPLEDLGLGELDKGQPMPIAPASNYVVGFPVILAVATYYAALAQSTKLYTAIIKEQVSSNRGLAPFLRDWSKLTNRLNPVRPVSLDAPFGNLTKGEVLRVGARMSVDVRSTWSCHRAEPVHCGECSGCLSRRGAFSAASIRDPTKYLRPLRHK